MTMTSSAISRPKPNSVKSLLQDQEIGKGETTGGELGPDQPDRAIRQQASSTYEASLIAGTPERHG